MTADRERWAVLGCVPCMLSASEGETPEDAWPRLIALHAAHAEPAGDVLSLVFFTLADAYGRDNVDTFEDEPNKIGVCFEDGSFVTCTIQPPPTERAIPGVNAAANPQEYDG